MVDFGDKRIFTIEDLEKLHFKELPGVPGARYAELHFEPAEVRVVHYRAGTVIPKHSHSGETLKIVLDGSIRFDDGLVGPGIFYHCNTRFSYGGMALKDTYLLLVQRRGTRTVREDEREDEESR